MITFLSVEDVLYIHAYSIGKEGGSEGVRDQGMLESAVHTPRQTYSGEYLHPTIAGMGAAYLFHLASNHPFLDGNKRVGARAMLAFLQVNGQPIRPSADELVRVTLAVANHEMSKAELTEWVEKLTGD